MSGVSCDYVWSKLKLCQELVETMSRAIQLICPKSRIVKSLIIICNLV